MSNHNDFNKVGQRMPYNAPQGFLDEIEQQVMARIDSDTTAASTAAAPAAAAPAAKAPSHRRLWWTIGTVLVAASVALLLIFKAVPAYQEMRDLNAIDQAFAELSTDDQDYLLEVYQDDLFMNSQELEEEDYQL